MRMFVPRLVTDLRGGLFRGWLLLLRMFIPRLVTDLRRRLFRGWLLTYEDVCFEAGWLVG